MITKKSKNLFFFLDYVSWIFFSCEKHESGFNKIQAPHNNLSTFSLTVYINTTLCAFLTNISETFVTTFTIIYYVIILHFLVKISDLKQKLDIKMYIYWFQGLFSGDFIEAGFYKKNGKNSWGKSENLAINYVWP